MTKSRTADRHWEDLPDRELVEEALHAEDMADRRSAFAAVFARHHRGVLAYCGGLLQDPHSAADAAAQTFTEAFTDLAALKEADKLRGWLLGIARNQCRKEWKRRARQEPLPEAEDEEDKRTPT
ncbi:hypothetical protein GCM10010252_27560 [Streptomyces aureoverticillatus]|nr:hypothetical protein GCM10010252_27560 [Streptomyces aureoverticillatus]